MKKNYIFPAPHNLQPTLSAPKQNLSPPEGSIQNRSKGKTDENWDKILDYWDLPRSMVPAHQSESEWVSGPEHNWPVLVNVSSPSLVKLIQAPSFAPQKGT